MHFIDAPVSGGVKGAQDGSLAIMAGASPEHYARVQPILAAMGITPEQAEAMRAQLVASGAAG